MRIAYLLHWNQWKASGVANKIKDQISEWRIHGWTVDVYLSCSCDAEGSPSDALKPILGEGLIEIERYTNKHSRIFSWLNVHQQIQRRDYDLIYMRYDLPVIGAIRLASRFKMIAEFNSDDLKENTIESGRSSVFRNIYLRLLRRPLHKRLAGAIFVTDELAKSNSYKSVNKRRYTVSNSISFERVPRLSVPRSTDLDFLFVGSPGQAWHGVDKLIRIASVLPGSRFHVVGPVIGGAYPKNVIQHGTKSINEYLEIAEGCTAAFGSLALHRKGMFEACPLKTREYLAMGLPVIIAYCDTDIPFDASYALHLPNTEEGVENHASDICRFAEAWRGRRVERSLVKSISTPEKEKCRLSIFSDFIRK